MKEYSSWGKSFVEIVNEWGLIASDAEVTKLL